MRLIKPLLLLFIIFSITVYSLVAQNKTYSSTSSTVEWQSYTMEEALETAANQNKDVLLYFYSDDCNACEDVQQTVSADHEIAGAINQYVPLKIDGESTLGKELREEYDIIAYPSFVFIDSEGEVFGNIIGHIEWSRKENLFLSLLNAPYAPKK